MAKILIIEDEPGIVHLLKFIITSMGHDVCTALNGTSGFDTATRERFDLILSDLHMPGSPTGMDLIRKLKKANPHCPVVVVSGHPSRDCLSECEALGITDFLTKPFELAFVQSVIEGIFKRKAGVA